MNDIKVSVNLATFTMAAIVWLVILGLKLNGVKIPEDISTIFAILTGVILTIVQGFEKGITFTSTTETTSSTKTTSTTDAKGASDEKINSSPPSPLNPTGL